MALDLQLVFQLRVLHDVQFSGSSYRCRQFKQRNAASPADVPTQTFGKNKEKSA